MTSPAPARPQADPDRLLRLLTPREAQALALLASGRDTRTIAEALGVSTGTARTHLHRAMRKLGVHTRAEAVAVAARLAPAPAAAAADADGGGGGAGGDAAAEPETGTGRAPEPTPTPVPVAGGLPGAVTEPRPEGFEQFCALTHVRLVQQTFLLTACRHRALHAVHLALSAAGRRWREVGALPDPEAWARAYAFEAAQAPWHRGGPRRAHPRRLPRRRIRVHPLPDAAAPEPDGLTPRDRDLLKALGRLTRPQLRALVLHDALGLSAEQVAAEVESSTAAAAGRVLSARAAMAASVPALVGPDPTAEGFGDHLGELLHRAAVHGCPAAKAPSPGLLRARGRLRSGLLTAAAGVVTLGMTATMVATLAGNGPSALFREPALAPPSVCSTADSGSAGPVRSDVTVWPGLLSHWCGPTPGSSLPLGPAPEPAPAAAGGATPGAAAGAATAEGLGPLAEAVLPPAPAPSAAQAPSAAASAVPLVPPVPVPVPAVPCPPLRLCPAAGPGGSTGPGHAPLRFELPPA
ncbi:LuxR C-terminal-related transcriptional regulator [Kitasatospora sp. NPDC001664]